MIPQMSNNLQLIQNSDSCFPIFSEIHTNPQWTAATENIIAELLH